LAARTQFVTAPTNQQHSDDGFGELTTLLVPARSARDAGAIALGVTGSRASTILRDRICLRGRVGRRGHPGDPSTSREAPCSYRSHEGSYVKWKALRS
jgi:hypothetical protein